MILDEIRRKERLGLVDLKEFTYSAPFAVTVLLAGVTVVNQVPINNDAPFLWCYTTFAAFSAAATPVPVPDVDIQYSLAGGGRNLQDVPQPLITLAGTAQLPYVLPEPVLFDGGSTFTVTATNNHAIAMRLHIAFKGYKTFQTEKYGR